MTPPAATRQPHPVYFWVEYDEHQDRWKTLLRVFLAIPQLIIVYVLQTLFSLLSLFAWFAILFTGRYPRGLFDLSVGIMRWSANVVAYLALLRDEYPPFAMDAGRYAVVLDIPYSERQSRWRLFVRFITIIPQYIVFQIVQLAWVFLTMMSWFALLVGARYPGRFFDFSVGTMRWYLRQQAYLYLLTDAYPPYCFSNTAPPDSEWASGLIGAPIFAAYVALVVFVSTAGTLAESATVDVEMPLPSPAFTAEPPQGTSNGLRITLLQYDDDAPTPKADIDRVSPLAHYVAFRVNAAKVGFLPTFFTAGALTLYDCEENAFPVADTTGDLWFHMFFLDDSTQGWVYFHVYERSQPCALQYEALGRVRFVFWRGFEAQNLSVEVQHAGDR